MRQVNTMIYLDNPATSMQKPAAVIESMHKSTLKLSVNAGRGSHRASLAGAEGIADTQELLADFFGIENPDRIAFCQNATHALNLAISGLLSRRDHVVMTSMEHNSVLRPVHRLCSYTLVEADKNGDVNPGDIRRAIRKNTKLVVTTHASNVCGTIMPVRQIGQICREYGIPYLLDAAQTAGVVPINAADMNLSMLAFSGHKGLMGPLGTGGLFVREDISLSPLIVGGTGTESENRLQPRTMPDMLHSGTLNTPAIVALGEAVRYINRVGINTIGERERTLAEELFAALSEIPGVFVYGKPNGNRNGTVAFNIGNRDSQEIAEILNRDYGIAVRGGYHCSYISHQTLGTEQFGAVRVGFGAFSSKKDSDALLFAVNKIANSDK